MSVDLWAMSSEINFPKCSLMYSSRNGTFLSFLQKDFGNKDLTGQKQQGEISKILQHSFILSRTFNVCNHEVQYHGTFEM